MAEQESLESTEQGLIYPCPYVYQYIRTWHMNGMEVGYETCDCDGTLIKTGTTRGTYNQTRLYYCGTSPTPKLTSEATE